MKKRIALYILSIALLISSLYYSSLHLIHGDVLFHTDTARDLLLIEDMVNTRSPDLIGPRAGGISGVYFGPIWYYAATPFFVIGKGNPIFIGVFWLLAVCLSIISVYWVSRKLFGNDTGILTAVMYSVAVIPTAKGFTQSFGSLILSPIIWYLLFKITESTDKKYLIALILILGVLFHLQPAFAMLTIFMSIVYTSIILYRRQQFKYILFYLLMILPLSNYIVFEIRNNFLHINSIIGFLTNPPTDRTKLSIVEIILNRMEGFVSRLQLIGSGILNSLAFLGLNVFIIFKTITDTRLKSRNFYFIFFGFYTGFWILSILFKGLVWDYYHWAFLPLVIIVFVSLYRIIPKQVFFAVYFIVFTLLFIQSKNVALGWLSSESNYDSSSWILNKNIAEYIYQDSEEAEIGYYVYSPDEFGYSVKYAMNYLQDDYISRADLCKKLPITYLIYYPTPEEYAKTDPVFWKKIRVGLEKDPIKVTTFGKGVLVEKYILDPEEILVESDPNLICNLHFR